MNETLELAFIFDFLVCGMEGVDAREVSVEGTLSSSSSSPPKDNLDVPFPLVVLLFLGFFFRGIEVSVGGGALY